MYAAAGIPQSALCDEFIRRDPAGYGFWLESAPALPGVAALALNGFGALHRDVMTRFAYLAPTIALVRDGADLTRSNGSVTVDRRGQPHVRYRLGPREREQVIAAIEAAARLQLAAGAREVRTAHTRPIVVRDEGDLAAIRSRRHGPNDVLLFSAHVNGTCRMGTDRRISGATPTGERHGVRGLYICDGSLLPTAPGVNPQETIMAIAALVAEGIAAR
jgi:choline dehydrogenase-like flavoprotein